MTRACPNVKVWELITSARRQERMTMCFNPEGLCKQSADRQAVLEKFLETTAPLGSGSECSLECVGTELPDDSPKRGWRLRIWNCYDHEDGIAVTMYRDGSVRLSIKREGRVTSCALVT